jgi:hypothetical protein
MATTRGFRALDVGYSGCDGGEGGGGGGGGELEELEPKPKRPIVTKSVLFAKSPNLPHR